jgi:transcription initiation factor TFIIB
MELSMSLVEQAGQLWKTVQKADLHIGRPYEATAAACVYAVCRISKNHRQLSGVAAHVGVPEDEVETAFYTLARELELPIPFRDPIEYVPQIVTDVDAGEDISQRARDIASRAGDCQELMGASPNGIAAGAVWCAVQDLDGGALQTSIADAAETTRQTTRSMANRLRTLEIASPCEGE